LRDDRLEEAAERHQPVPGPNPGQAGVVGQRLVRGVAEVPAVGQVQAGDLDQLTLRADPLEEHDQLELEEDDRVDARPPAVLIGAADQGADERQIELRLKQAIEVVRGDQGVQRRQYRLVHPTTFGRAEHRGASLGAQAEREQIS